MNSSASITVLQNRQNLRLRGFGAPAKPQNLRVGEPERTTTKPNNDGAPNAVCRISVADFCNTVILEHAAQTWTFLDIISETLGQGLIRPQQFGPLRAQELDILWDHA
jgi:hypothetical protein